MIDLIPIGTVNRTATENNSIKRTDNVKEAEKAEPMDVDHKQPLAPVRRRFKRRQGDRRTAKVGRWNRFERRSNRDRRGEESDLEQELLSGGLKSKKTNRKGRFIDERA